MDDIARWFQWLHQATGIKLTIFYDAYDRSRFLQGFVTTLKLSAYCLAGSLVIGALLAWLRGSRSVVVLTRFTRLFVIAGIVTRSASGSTILR